MRLLLTIAVLTICATTSFAQVAFDPPLGNGITFPDTPINQSSEIVVTATSQGNGAWTVRLNSNNGRFTVTPAQFAVQDGAQQQFTLRFTPTAAGRVNGVLSGTATNPRGNQQRISCNLIGTGVEGAPAISLDADTLWLEVYCDELGIIWNYSSADVTVSNTGNLPLHVTNITDNRDWLSETPTQFNVAAGQSEVVTFSVTADLPPETYRATATIASDDPNHRNLNLPVVFQRGFIPHFLLGMAAEPPATNHALMIDDAVIGGEQLTTWDEVGVFTPRGDLAGRTYYSDSFPLALIAWGEDQPAGFDGFRAGDSFTFKYYDYSADSELPAYPTYSDGSETFRDQGLTTLILSDAPEGTEQVFPLRRAWQIISLRVSPDRAYWANQSGPDVPRLFADVVANLSVAKDAGGRFYTPANRFNNIPYLSLESGLLVRMSSADTLTIHGAEIALADSIHLLRGWNIAAYYPNRTMTMATAFAPLTDAHVLVLAKNGIGQFYTPQLGFGGETPITPGEGLLVKVSSAAAFRYPAQREEQPRRDDENVQHFPHPGPTDVNMSLIVSNISGFGWQEGAELAAVTPRNRGGRVAGATTLEAQGPWGMALWGDDASTQDTVEGFHEGDSIRFLYWDPVTGWELPAAFSVEQGPSVYTTNDLAVYSIAVDVQKREDYQPGDFALLEPYPNPFNSSTTVRFQVPYPSAITLRLIDLFGREITIVAKGTFEQGEHQVTLSGSYLPGGIYLLRLEAAGHSETRRVLLLK